MEEDPSVDVSSKTRGEIQAELEQFGLKTNQNTAQLRNQLKNALMERHPIHEWLSELTNEDLKNRYQLIFPSCRKQTFDRMMHEIW